MGTVSATVPSATKAPAFWPDPLFAISTDEWETDRVGDISESAGRMAAATGLPLWRCVDVLGSVEFGDENVVCGPAGSVDVCGLGAGR